MLTSGFFDLPWWGLALVALALTHITIVAVTLYLHRSQAHRALDFHPVVAHFFRAWLWLTTGMTTKQWVAVHRKHHAKVDTADDPHSPQTHGIKKLMLAGVLLYSKEARNAHTLSRYGAGTPSDWAETKLYAAYPLSGLVLTAMVDMALFGILPGALLFMVQIAWIPFWAAGVVNGLGHYAGYRNFDSEDASRNLFPWGILIGGEELHNNHHAHPTSAKLSFRPHEFDIGWVYICVLQLLRLAKVKKVAARPAWAQQKEQCCALTLQAILANRHSVLRDFAKLLRQVSKEDLDSALSRSLKSVWLRLKSADLHQSEASKVAEALAKSPTLGTLAKFREELCALWEDATATEAQLVERLNAWCRRAEGSGHPPLTRFSQSLRGYA